LHSPSSSSSPLKPGLEIKGQKRLLEAERNHHIQITPHRESHVTTGTREPATSLQPSASGSTFVANARECTKGETALWQRELDEGIAINQNFRRWMIWGNDSKSVSKTAIWTESAEPLP
jgi:hypothetical protein